MTRAEQSWTISSLLDSTQKYLEGKGSGSARLDAELLLSRVLNKDRLRLYLEFDRPVLSNELSEYRELVKRRAQHEPVAYILGHKEFWSMNFAVSPGVLIPRPDTEVLVDVVCKILSHNKNEPRLGFEVGPGSGAISLSLLKELPGLHMQAIEISNEAFLRSQHNAQIHGLMDRFQVFHGDFLASLETSKKSEKFDLVVSNPPYITNAEYQTLAPDILNFEPREALVAEDDGLIFYKKIAPFAFENLKPNGVLVVEIGETQAEAVTTIFKKNGFRDVSVTKDFAKWDRVVVGRL